MGHVRAVLIWLLRRPNLHLNIFQFFTGKSRHSENSTTRNLHCCTSFHSLIFFEMQEKRIPVRPLALRNTETPSKKTKDGEEDATDFDGTKVAEGYTS